MSSIQIANTSNHELLEAVKEKRIGDLLAQFYCYKKQAENANNRGWWMLEAGFRELLTNAAENIFQLAGLTDAQTSSREILDGNRSQHVDGLEPVNDLQRLV